MSSLPKIPWDQAPDWANYAAYQPSGVLRWFQHKPIRHFHQWSLSLHDGKCQDHEPLTTTQWRQSLERRPE
jgi:hypothetical protein